MPPPVPGLAADVRYLAPPYPEEAGRGASPRGRRGVVAVLRLNDGVGVDGLRRTARWIHGERDEGRTVALLLNRGTSDAGALALDAYPLGFRALLFGEVRLRELRRQLTEAGEGSVGSFARSMGGTARRTVKVSP